MTGGPHPMVAIMSTERRRKELLAEADRDRQIYLAQRRPARHPPRSHVFTVVAIFLMLALMVAMSNAPS